MQLIFEKNFIEKKCKTRFLLLLRLFCLGKSGRKSVNKKNGANFYNLRHLKN